MKKFWILFGLLAVPSIAYLYLQTGKNNFKPLEILGPIEIQSKKVDLSSFQHTWDEFSKDQKKFDDLRKIIMRASILLSPLYVGKASNLKIRCYQHINGNGSDNSFHKRFEDYANKVNSKSKKVSDLLFVAIKTEETQGESQESEKLVEGILKNLVKPKYSII